MNDMKLIKLVRQHTVMYDLSHSQYMDSGLKEKIWQKIGEEMKIDGAICKARWNNIRDNYRKSLKKRAKKSGEEATKMKKYKYTEQMSFLNEYFQEREMKANLDNQDEEDERKYQEYERQCKLERDNENIHSVTDDQNCLGQYSFRPMTRLKSQPRENVASSSRNYSVNKNEQTFTTITAIHPVDAFLAGIAPTLKTLTPYYLNLARSKIFAAVQEYEMAMLTQQGLVTSGNKTEEIIFSTSPLPCHFLQQTSSYSETSSPTAPSPPNYHSA